MNKNNGLGIVNVSAEGANPLQVPRHSLRDERGRYSARPLPHRAPVLCDAVTSSALEGAVTTRSWFGPRAWTMTSFIRSGRITATGPPSEHHPVRLRSAPRHLRRMV